MDSGHYSGSTIHLPAGIVQGGIFLRKMPLESSGSGVQQLWNRYNNRCAYGPVSELLLDWTRRRAHWLMSPIVASVPYSTT